MTKIELIKVLKANQLPDDTEILINVSKYFNGKAIWSKIDCVDKTEHGEPILLYLDKDSEISMLDYGLKR